MRTSWNRYTRYWTIVAFVLGTGFFSVLPVFAPPVVLQSDEMPGFLLGLGASVVAGAALRVAARGSIGRGLLVVVASVFCGGVLHTFAYAIPTYGLAEEPVLVWPLFVAVTLVYLGVPATIGAALAGAASASIAGVWRRRGERR